MKTLEKVVSDYSIDEIISTIENHYNNNLNSDMRIITHIEIGQIVRQGDIYINRVDDNHTHGYELSTKQLAEGTTNGSRHIVENHVICYLGTTRPEYYNEKAFLGPCIKSDKEFIISHPEHANVKLPAGTYQITHQLDARTLQRVRD